MPGIGKRGTTRHGNISRQHFIRGRQRQEERLANVAMPGGRAREFGFQTVAAFFHDRHALQIGQQPQLGNVNVNGPLAKHPPRAFGHRGIVFCRRRILDDRHAAELQRLNRRNKFPRVGVHLGEVVNVVHRQERRFHVANDHGRAGRRSPSQCFQHAHAAGSHVRAGDHDCRTIFSPANVNARRRDDVGQFRGVE